MVAAEPPRDSNSLLQPRERPSGGARMSGGGGSPAAAPPTFDVAVLIVSYARPQDVATCLRALSRLARKPAIEVFVAENGGPAAFDALVAELTGDRSPCVVDDHD